MKPDLRIRSAGAAGAYGLQPLTDAGKAFVEELAATINGSWHEGVYWIRDMYMPRHALSESPLNIVGGVGDTDEYDVPWPR